MKDVTEKHEKLREAIYELTRPINGQYPRPWMAYGDPAEADVFIVGMNQRKAYKVGEVGEHHQFLDAHFNVHSPDCCRALYDRVSGGNPSPTRCNTDRIRACLEHAGAAKILETNVICYSSPMSEDLRPDGIERGAQNLPRRAGWHPPQSVGGSWGGSDENAWKNAGSFPALSRLQSEIRASPQVC